MAYIIQDQKGDRGLYLSRITEGSDAMIDITEDEVICWIAAGALAFGLAFSAEDCAQYTEGTDMYHACESNWEPIDLTPVEGE